MNDPTESIRRQMVAEINANPQTREELEQHGQVWDAQQLAEEFEVIGFAAPLVVVRRKDNHALGSLKFQHEPRLYFGFKPHD